MRLVGLSATLPNYEDVAALLRVKRDRGLFFFGAAYRPCPLAQTFIGVTVKKPLQRFQLMNDICYNKVADAAGKHQVRRLEQCHELVANARGAFCGHGREAAAAPHLGTGL